MSGLFLFFFVFLFCFFFVFFCFFCLFFFVFFWFFCFFFICFFFFFFVFFFFFFFFFKCRKQEQHCSLIVGVTSFEIKYVYSYIHNKRHDDDIEKCWVKEKVIEMIK